MSDTAALRLRWAWATLCLHFQNQWARCRVSIALCVCACANASACMSYPARLREFQCRVSSKFRSSFVQVASKFRPSFVQVSSKLILCLVVCLLVSMEYHQTTSNKPKTKPVKTNTCHLNAWISAFACSANSTRPELQDFELSRPRSRQPWHRRPSRDLSLDATSG